MYTKEHNNTNKNLIARDDLFCPYCDKQCKNLNSLKQHEIRCKQNPNRSINGFINVGLEAMIAKNKEQGSWNRGLTKETDERVRVNIEARSGNNGWLGKHHSEETKAKISEALLKHNHADQKRNLHSHGGWIDGIYVMSTYELVYYIYCRDLGKNITRCTERFSYIYNNQEHFYTPDFVCDDVIVEIKGREVAKDLEKYKAVDKPFKVLYKADLVDCFNYVKNNYIYNKLEDLYEDR